MSLEVSEWPEDKVMPVLLNCWLMVSHRRVSGCNNLLFKTVWSLAMLRLPYNTPVVNFYV